MSSSHPRVSTEFVAMVDVLRNRESTFKLNPVFLHSSLDDIHEDAHKLIEWKLLWNKWALENPRRINVKKWQAPLKFLQPINGVKGIVYDKLGGVKSWEDIVDGICMAVLPEVKFEISHIEGRSRLCKVIQDTIASVQFKGVSLVGLYGMGGIGKTSICKVLYNEFFIEFQGRVCYGELERRSKGDLLQDVLGRLTYTNPKLLDGRNIDN